MLTLSGIVFNIISRRTTTTAAVTQTSSSSTTSKIDDDKATVMFVLGGPGAGKGTQCSNLVQVWIILDLGQS